LSRVPSPPQRMKMGVLAGSTGIELEVTVAAATGG
jgi:hypothetical protein